LGGNVSQINAQVSQSSKRPAPKRIAENAIGSVAIQPNAVVQEAIADGAVGNKQLTADAVQTATIKDASVTDPKIVTVSAAKLTGTMNSTVIVNATSVSGTLGTAQIPDLSAAKITSGTFPSTGVTVPAAIISGNVAIANVAYKITVSGQGNGSITFSASNPSGGSSGDIWIKYV
jgi:hypothetical protein